LFLDVIWGAETESGISFCVTCLLFEIQLKIVSKFFCIKGIFSNFDGNTFLIFYKVENLFAYSLDILFYYIKNPEGCSFLNKNDRPLNFAKIWHCKNRNFCKMS